jgi:5-methylcytosine-specific restriction endonuclease McrA
MLKHRRKVLWRRQRYRCALCGGGLRWKDATLDHIVPRAHGGSNRLSNLQAVHGRCNRFKGSAVEAPLEGEPAERFRNRYRREAVPVDPMPRRRRIREAA